MRTVWASIATAVVAAVATAVPAHAEEVSATCGAVLTTDAYLAGDLVCADAGLTLDGDVTLDLRGHRLSGTAPRTAITVTTGHSVQVTNGQIDHWAFGLQVGGPFGPDVLGTITVTDVTFADNIYGINGQASQGNIAAFLVTGSRFTGNRDGFHGDFAAALRVNTSTFARNETAVYVDTGASVAIVDTKIERNATGLRCFATVCRALRTTFTRNDQGATSGDYGNIELTRSTVTGNDVGYTAGYGVLAHNTFSNNNTGVKIVESGSVQATENLFSGNGVGVTTVVTEGYTPRAELTNNRFLRNIDGVYVTLNPDDSDSQALLSGNTAVGNKRYGIYAPGATDLGNNKATKNGADCVGVECRQDLGWPRCTGAAHAQTPTVAGIDTALSQTSVTMIDDRAILRPHAFSVIPPNCIPDRPGISWQPDPRSRRFPR